MAIKIFKSRILKSEILGLNMKHLVFSFPKNFEFKAGQYLSLTVFINGKKIRKPYSIASSPGKKQGNFYIKLVKGGRAFKELVKIKKNDVVELFGPAGKFIVQPTSKRKALVFISTGTGISTFMSMIPDLLENGFRKKIILIKGFHNEKEVICDKEFLKLKKKHKNFDFFNVLSKPKNKKYSLKGYVQDFLEELVPKNFSGDYYLCGLHEMIKDVSKKLESSGVGKKRIFFEKYN